ncbi:MAG: hypothetical protein EOP93_01810 [Lysobacteraceae bacterium]|nr:MAG: hypothetical protein EOP93_01810 [Xanthomonadaceae bacterium]
MNAVKCPAWFWVVAALGLLWNLFGLFSFYYHLTATADVIGTWPEPQQRLFEAIPRWVFVPFAIATIGGVLGSLGLLLRKRWAVPVLLLSLLAIIVQFTANYLTTPLWEVTGVQGALLPATIALVGLFLWWFARKAAARGWLR